MPKNSTGISGFLMGGLSEDFQAQSLFLDDPVDVVLTHGASLTHELWTLPAEFLTKTWTFFEGNPDDLKPLPGFVWVAVPVSGCLPGSVSCGSSVSCNSCFSGLGHGCTDVDNVAALAREGVVNDSAVVCLGPSRLLCEFECTVDVFHTVWNDPAVLFCSPSLELSWLRAELKLNGPEGSEVFDVDELCLIALEARLDAELGFDVHNGATFECSSVVWDADAAALASHALRCDVAVVQRCPLRCLEGCGTSVADMCLGLPVSSAFDLVLVDAGCDVGATECSLSVTEKDVVNVSVVLFGGE
jgi:hypothetical protein